tara:strand:+ start:274 stop:861 length:588 start_codon:yes stop_codon:yes gene_type:complete
MKKKYQKTQFFLVIFGLMLIVLTYFYYPNIKDEKLKKTENILNEEIDGEEGQGTTFENVEYKGIYDLDKPFTVKSEKALILNKDPAIVYMENMRVLLYLTDSRVVTIQSDFGKYNKDTYDLFFESNVTSTDGKTKIYSENLELLATENLVKIYNDVIVNDVTGSLRADRVDYDFETRYFKISMFDEERVKMKVIK